MEPEPFCLTAILMNGNIPPEIQKMPIVIGQIAEAAGATDSGCQGHFAVPTGRRL
jgi:hypothetical protein